MATCCWPATPSGADTVAAGVHDAACAGHAITVVVVTAAATTASLRAMRVRVIGYPFPAAGLWRPPPSDRPAGVGCAAPAEQRPWCSASEIGRASCRERV